MNGGALAFMVVSWAVIVIASVVGLMSTVKHSK